MHIYSVDKTMITDNLLLEMNNQEDRERLKLASKSLLDLLRGLLVQMPTWAQNTQTQADVKVFVLDHLWQSLPRPPFTDQDTESLADRVYDYVWQRSMGGAPLGPPPAA